MIRTTVLGASGRCGSWVTRLAAARGMAVRAVVRATSAYEPPPGVRVIQGEVTDPEFLAATVADSHTIISCVGLRRAGPLPWSRLMSPPDLVTAVMRGLIDASPPDARVIWVSAGGVGDSLPATTWPIRRLIRTGNVGVAYDDLESAEAAVRESGRPWLAVRPVTLLPGTPSGRVGPVSRYGLTSAVRRADVATWMLDVAEGSLRWDRNAVLLGSVSDD